MNASSESGECASVMFSDIVLLDHANAIAFDTIVDSVALDGFEACVFNQADEFCLTHFYFVVRFDGVTRRQLTAFGDRAVNVISAIVQSNLRQAFAEHDPI